MNENVFFDLLKNAINLDIFDLNYVYGSEKIGQLAASQNVLPRPGITVRIGSFLWHFICSFKQLMVNKSRTLRKNCILFLFCTGNQRDALIPIVKCMKKRLFLLVLIHREN